jgi:diacylglycerol kinase family enzyme
MGGYVIGGAWIGVLAALGRFSSPPPLPGPVATDRAVSREKVSMMVVMSRNPGSLRDRPAMQAQLRPLMKAHGIEPVFADLEARGISARIRRAIDDGVSAVVAAGGDGTISFVGQQLVGRDIPLGVIPLGTMNLFAKDVGIPVGSLDAAVRVLAGGHVRHVDVGDVNGRVFLCGSMLGLPARLAQYRKRGNTWWESVWLWMRYGRALFRALVRFRPFRATLSLGDRQLRVSVSSLMITPNPVNGESGPLLGRTELAGDTLAVYVIDRVRPLDVLRLDFRALFLRWQSDPVVSDYTVRRLAIVSRSPSIRVMNDGEVTLLSPPLRYRVLPRALAVICPPQGRDVA